MNIVKTRKPFPCWKCDEMIPAGSITLQVIVNDMPRAIRKYYHQKCGMELLASTMGELERAK